MHFVNHDPSYSDRGLYIIVFNDVNPVILVRLDVGFVIGSF
jgi:hypothetical protein